MLRTWGAVLAVVALSPCAFTQEEEGPNAAEAIKAFEAARVEDEPAAKIVEDLRKLEPVKDGRVVRLLSEYAGHPSADVGRVSLDLISKIRLPESVDVLIRLMDEARPSAIRGPSKRQAALEALSGDIQKALERLTGQSKKDAKEWRKWWFKTGRSFGGGGGKEDAEVYKPIPGQTYSMLSVDGPPTDKPAAEHPDINVKLRAPQGFKLRSRGGSLQQIAGATDDKAVKLYSMFTDNRVPVITAIYTAGKPQDEVAGFAVEKGEIIEAPKSGRDIHGGGHAALVLYADDDQITLKYTRDDNVVRGYTLHVVGIAVEPTLLKKYREANAAGRKTLPAVRHEQPMGRAKGREILVVIRDCGSFMPPLSKKDWW